MAKKRKCECCDAEICNVPLVDFDEWNWTAYEIRNKLKCFCPDHFREMKKQMSKDLEGHYFKGGRLIPKKEKEADKDDKSN